MRKLVVLFALSLSTTAAWAQAEKPQVVTKLPGEEKLSTRERAERDFLMPVRRKKAAELSKPTASAEQIATAAPETDGLSHYSEAAADPRPEEVAAAAATAEASAASRRAARRARLRAIERAEERAAEYRAERRAEARRAARHSSKSSHSKKSTKASRAAEARAARHSSKSKHHASEKASSHHSKKAPSHSSKSHKATASKARHHTAEKKVKTKAATIKHKHRR
jgi:hypothetical protein